MSGVIVQKWWVGGYTQTTIIFVRVSCYKTVKCYTTQKGNLKMTLKTLSEQGCSFTKSHKIWTKWEVLNLSNMRCSFWEGTPTLLIFPPVIAIVVLRNGKSQMMDVVLKTCRLAAFLSPLTSLKVQVKSTQCWSTMANMKFPRLETYQREAVNCFIIPAIKRRTG